MSNTEIENVVQEAKQLALKLENDRMKLEDELKEWLSILNQVFYYFAFFLISLL